MPQQPVSTYFLHVYDVESGLWAQLQLGSGVSPRIREAMNVILSKDGILGFIGTRSEFGHYLSELKRDRGTDFRHCWTSLPASTIMSMLGLCLNMPMSGTPELVFAGSPRTLMLSYILDVSHEIPDILPSILQRMDGSLKRNGLILMETSMQEQLGFVNEIAVTESEYQEALSYAHDMGSELPALNKDIVHV